jgi:hypothetical protein
MGTMTDEQFEDYLKRTLPDLDPVPPTPRDAMWANIQEQRRTVKQITGRNRQWLGWGVGLAAMLAIGVGLGRLSVRNAADTADAPVAIINATTTNATRSEPVNRTAYRLTVEQHMTSAEALLTSFKTQPQGTLDPDIAVWARDLLTNTRMLLDSPAADDPKVAALLEDLELVIAQIARMSAPSSVERELIREGIQKTDVLPRLRASQSAGT